MNVMENSDSVKEVDIKSNINANNKHSSQESVDNTGHESKRLKTEDHNESSEIENKRIERRPDPKQKVKKWILLLSYCGNGYYGMQRQSWDSTFPTIEGSLLESLWKSGVIDEEKYKSPHLCRFQRAARTDKGVSAIKQIVSIILPTNFNDSIININQILPKQIQVMNALRVTKFFDAKNFCDARTYSYLMPSYSICPIDLLTTQSFRSDKETIDKFNDILSTYLGTHNYHNFTAHKKATDPSATRYIIEMNCSQPFIMDDLEFVVVRVKGQSFMLHQIRKMIGLTIAIMRGLTDEHTISKAFECLRLDIPMAPGLGLLLEEVHYDRYNQKYGGDGVHEPIKWDQNSAQIDQFKHQYIYPVIVETEKNEMSMFKWLQTLPLHTYDVREQGVNDTKLTDQTEQRSALFKAYINANNCQNNQQTVEQSIQSESEPHVQ